MNSKGHLTMSLFKSAIRIIGSAYALFSIFSYVDSRTQVLVLAACIFIAEMLGIAEELLDERE